MYCSIAMMQTRRMITPPTTQSTSSVNDALLLTKEKCLAVSSRIKTRSI
jgi:hypothetical protein